MYSSRGPLLIGLRRQILRGSAWLCRDEAGACRECAAKKKAVHGPRAKNRLWCLWNVSLEVVTHAHHRAVFRGEQEAAGQTIHHVRPVDAGIGVKSLREVIVRH